MLQSTAELIQNQLKTVGIRLNLSPIEKAAYTADLRKGDFDAYFSGGGNPNPKRNFTFIDPRLSHNESGGSAGQKWYDDQDYIAELCDRCLKTVDDDERMQAFTEINDILMEYVPKIYLYAAYKAILTTDDIIGFNLISMGAVNLKTVYPAEYLEG